MGVKKTAPYNSAPYDVLADNIICISLGAPRCMGSSVAKKFCNFASQKKILFLRITTRGDPVPALPPKTGFQHPCSDDSKMRMEISEDCNATLTMRPMPNVNYTANLDCQNYKTRTYIPNALSHTIYLDILYTKAVDIPKFFKGIGIAQEVSRGPGKSTICRLVMGQTGNYKVIFFDVNKSRVTPSNLDAVEDIQLSKPDPNAASQIEGSEPKGGGLFSSFNSKLSGSINKPTIKIGGEIAEDRRMTKQAFNTLMEKMVPLEGDLCPQKGEIAEPFNTQAAPDLSCPSLKFGGRRKSRSRKLGKRKNKKRNTRKR
jgi:hypothetical protein